jgi:flavin-dependent dehydrogenase
MTDEGWPAYAWSFPIGDGRANIGYGMLRSRLGAVAAPASTAPAGTAPAGAAPAGTGLAGPASIGTGLAGPASGRSADGRPNGARPAGAGGRAVLHGTLAKLLPDQPAHPGTLRAHHLPMSTWRPRQPDGPVLLVGDAASLINPLTGEGIYYALLSGSLAGEAAVQATTPARAGATYRRALNGELGRHLRHTALLADLAGRHRALMDAAVRAAGGRTELYDTLVEIGLGKGTIPAASLARLGVRRALRLGR